MKGGGRSGRGAVRVRFLTTLPTLHSPLSTLHSRQTRLANQFQQLAMHVEPLADSVERQEVLPTGLAKLIARKFRFQLVVKIPEFQVGDEIGPLVGPGGVRGVGGLLLVQGRSRGSCTASAAAMMSTSCRQSSSPPARIIRPKRGSIGRPLNCRPTSVSSPVASSAPSSTNVRYPSRTASGLGGSRNGNRSISAKPQRLRFAE